MFTAAQHTQQSLDASDAMDGEQQSLGQSPYQHHGPETIREETDLSIMAKKVSNR